MAMVRSSPPHSADDQVDSDFFDQLANEFGAGDPVPLQSDFYQDERDRLDDAFSKLLLGEEDCAPRTLSSTDAPVSSSFVQEIDRKSSIELASLLKDDNAKQTPGVTESCSSTDEALSTVCHSTVGSASHAGEYSEVSEAGVGSVKLNEDFDNGIGTQLTAIEASPCLVSANSLAAAEGFLERVRGDGLEPSGFRETLAGELESNARLPYYETSKLNVTSIDDNDSDETSHPGPVQDSSFALGNEAPFVAKDHSQPEFSGIKLQDRCVSQAYAESCTAQAWPEGDVARAPASPGVKELQWSSFGISCVPNAFGSYSDFFSELGSENSASVNQQVAAPIGGYQAEPWADSSALLNAQGSLDRDSFGLQPNSSFDYSSLEHFDERALWNRQGLLNVGVVDPDNLGSTSLATGMSERQHDNESKQSVVSSDVVSGADIVKDMSRSSDYEVQSQQHAQQSWENEYPGWYFDYASNGWKQIEGWSAEQGQHLVSDEVDSNYLQASESSQLPTMESNSLWQSGQGQNFWLNSGSDHGLTTGNYAANDERQAASSSLPEHEINWEQQYPGWYYDYQTQQWRQIADAGQTWGSNQDPQLLASSGSTESVQNSQSLGGGWIDQQGQPQYHSGVKDSIYAPERSQAFHGNGEGSELNNLGRGMSFNSWTEPTTEGFGITEQGVHNIQSGGSISPWIGFQGADMNASYHPYQAISDSATQFQQDSILLEKQAVVGSFFQSHPASTGAVGQERSSEGRPSHALVAFGFGGKLVTMKASHVGNAEPLVLHNLNSLVSRMEGQNGVSPYFSVLNRLGLSGPLHGCSSKDVLRWVDERIENYEKEEFQGANSQGIHVLWGVLKIACQHYGKLRSVAGSVGIKSQMEEGPEIALKQFLNTIKSHSHWNQGLPTSTDALHSFPDVHQIQAAVNEVTNQLMDGKLKDAVQIAQQGQLWGLALVLAWQLGEKVYADTVLKMAQKQFSPGSPMRTLLLLFAGQASELFKAQNLSSFAGHHGSYAINASNSQDSAGGMLSDWLGNLSIIAANHTKGDEQVIIHLGDSLWKDRGEVAGAHTCYLVADANFESFSKDARLCLVGADHFKYQRTFATPQAIQRTEVYEYAKTLGNPQYVLVPFQPFKLLYGHMLAEAGRITEASRYCQVVIKNLKSAGRGSEIEFCKQSAVALDERLRQHSQGGYSLNFSTGKLVGRVMGTIDSTIHKIIGGPPLPQQPPASFGSAQQLYANDRHVSSTMKVTSMMPSASNNSLSSVNGQVDVPTRSISEPNLISSITQESNFETASGTPSTSPSPSRLKSTAPNGGGYIGRFGSQILARARGLMRHSKEAKLGDENTFYYDEKLKRWVEAGAEHSTEEAVLAPPPMVAGFNSSSGSPSDVKSGEEAHGPSAVGSSSADLPPIPPSVNQFSARGRLNGVRSRYVDTFNKGNAQPVARPSSSPAPLPNVSAVSRWAVAGSPSQFFPSTSVTSAANGSSDNFGSLQKDDGSSELQAPASDNAYSGYMQVENEPLLPKNLNSSFMDVPLMQKHSSTGNLANDRLYITSDFSSLNNMSRAVSWSGESPNLVQHNLSNGSMVEAHSRNSLNGAGTSSLPSPPILEPPPLHTGYSSGQMHTVTAEGMFSDSLHGAALGELREVDL